MDKYAPQKGMKEMVERTLLSADGNMMMVRVVMPKGFQGQPDQHIEEQLTYVAEGKVEFELNGSKRIVGKGDVVHILSNESHRVTVLEDCVLLDIFSPMRKDVLEQLLAK
ncbi:cupin domain-containing protein [Anaerosolibacter sp.]|uniref:cupin domain-containing protein n=1 Tax=Anaerosolibacter sp. TaxID=1872527 RepID=UPI0039F081D3